MKDEELRRLIRLVEESQIDELEIRKLWTRVRITKSGALNRTRPAEEASVSGRTLAVSVPAGEESPFSVSPARDAPASAEIEDGLVPIVSPIVGTFYAAPAPDAPPYVDVGSRVRSGQVVCIVEAMKLMNEIEAEVNGTVQRVLVENAQPVEFNQALYLIRPDSA